MVRRIVVFSVVGTTLFATLLFGAAGRLDVPAFWAYVILWSIYLALSSAMAQRKHPDLVRERMQPPSDRDPTTRKLAAVPGLGHFLVAGLDVGRFGWSHVPLALQVVAFGVMIVGLGFVAWTFLTNRYASSAVRVQKERGQVVIDTGPYALVRHPMYLGTVLVACSSGLALGSWWSQLLMLLIVPIFVRRTLLEDRMLHDELPGYPDYARRTRWRVVPGVF